jgi:hypothetical protein
MGYRKGRMTTKEFAPEYTRNEHGWILFPNMAADGKYRNALFPESVKRHTAKAQMYLIKSIVEYVSEPGEIIMDIMAGSGTIMLAATLGRRVVCIELEEIYQRILYESLEMLSNNYPGTEKMITILQGDCRNFMPIPVNHIIFSPPYAQILTTRKGPSADSTKGLAGSRVGAEDGSWSPDYTKDHRNIGRLNTFLYNQAMERVYSLCYESVLPGGTLTTIIQDFMRDGKRVYLSEWVNRICITAGFEQIGWYKRMVSGTGFKKCWRSKGIVTVDDEDLLMFRRLK